MPWAPPLSRYLQYVHSFRLSGVEGRRAAAVNGVFDPEEGPTGAEGGTPVYRKREEPSVYMEYRTADKQWLVRRASHAGDWKPDWALYASLLSDPPLLPHLINGAEWQVTQGAKWTPQPQVSLALVSTDENNLHTML